MDEEDEIEENESFQPFEFLIPEETEWFEPQMGLSGSFDGKENL